MKQDNQTFNRVDKAWERMSGVLDTQMPQRKRRYGFIIWLFGLAGLLTAVGIYSLNKGSITTEPFASKTSEHTSALALNPALSSDNKMIPIGTAQEDETSAKDQTEASSVSSLNSDSKKKNLPITKNNGQTKQIRIKTSEANNSKLSKLIMNETSKLNPSKGKAEKTPLNSNSKENEFDFKLYKAGESKQGAITHDERAAAGKQYQASILERNKKLHIAVFLPQLSQDIVYSLRPATLVEPELASLDHPVIKPQASSPIVFSVAALTEYLPDFNTSGVGIGLQLEKSLASHWSIGLRLAYMANTRQLSENPAGRDLDGLFIEDVPGTSGGQETLTEESRFTILKENTDKLNSISLESFFAYSPINRISLQLGFGVERYNSQLNIKGETSDEEISNGANTNYSVINQTAYIALVSGGLSFNISNHWGLYAGYRLALKNFYNNTTGSVKTNKIIGGILYSF